YWNPVPGPRGGGGPVGEIPQRGGPAVPASRRPRFRRRLRHQTAVGEDVAAARFRRVTAPVEIAARAVDPENGRVPYFAEPVADERDALLTFLEVPRAALR